MYHEANADLQLLPPTLLYLIGVQIDKVPGHDGVHLLEILCRLSLCVVSFRHHLFVFPLLTNMRIERLGNTYRV